MITQTFLTEFEMALIRSYAHAIRVTSSPKPGEASFISVTGTKEEFMQSFMKTFSSKRSVLEPEIIIGGHQQATQLMDKISGLVENRMRQELTRNNLLDKKMGEKDFRKVVESLKLDVRSFFYKGYLGEK